MRTNSCNPPVIQENRYAIANINPETVDTVQKTKTMNNNNNNLNDLFILDECVDDAFAHLKCAPQLCDTV